ncbi:MAG TPA: hypothetical protein VHS34_10935 [Terriglobales bacterium]|jgi:methyl-accepting chemotaxis protein|nr:hypothetical protein [Terriglobales bacterium]
MSIATKLGLFLAGVIVIFSALAVAMLAQLRSVALGYDALLNTQVRQMQAARVVQVTFKKQVQEWKDILLRGYNPDDLAKYTGQFHNREAEVHAGAQALAGTVDDANARKLLTQFLAAHQVMSEKYQLAYEAYVAGQSDFKAADKMVRGQDRAPTDLFDQVVQALDGRVTASVEAQRAATARNRNLVMSGCGGLLAVFGLLGWLTVRSILRRLVGLREVSDRLSRGDLEGLVVNISGHDEIGEFGESMKGVHAAFAELIKIASSPAPLG